MRFGLALAAAFVATSLSAQEPAEQQEQAAPEVTHAVVATGVQDREPVGVAETFPMDVGTLYFYTVFEGDFPEQTVRHIWLREGEEVGRVELRVRGPRWRTWSTKTIPTDWTGSWTARVEDAQGNVLANVEFTVGM